MGILLADIGIHDNIFEKGFVSLLRDWKESPTILGPVKQPLKTTFIVISSGHMPLSHHKLWIGNI